MYFTIIRKANYKIVKFSQLVGRYGYFILYPMSHFQLNANIL